MGFFLSTFSGMSISTPASKRYAVAPAVPEEPAIVPGIAAEPGIPPSEAHAIEHARTVKSDVTWSHPVVIMT